MTQKRSLIPYIFFIFFGVIFIVDATFIYLANSTWRGVYTTGGYEKGKDYNKTILAVKKQNSLGWEISIANKKIGKNLALIKICLKDSKKKLITDAKIQAKLTRPTQEGFDFKQDLLPKNGCYFAQIQFPLQGVWDVEIQAFKDQNVFQEVKRYVIR